MNEVNVEGPKNPGRSDLPRLVEFLSGHLRPGVEWAIDKEYPQVFNEQNLHNIHFVEDQGQILAHAALKISLTQTPGGIFKLAAIGSVVTHPQFRQQGLSRMIIDHCLKKAEEQNCDLAILWSDLYDFYKKIGFSLAGQEILAIINEELMNERVPHRVMDTVKIDPNALLKLYQKHTVHSHRTEEDIRKNLSIPNTRVFTSWGMNNEILAYAVVGKGADLLGYVHEWGGGVSHLIPLLSHIRRVFGQPITVISPAHAQNFIRQLQDKGVQIIQGHLGLMKIVNPKNVAFKVMRYLRLNGFPNLQIEVQDQSFVLKNEGTQTVFKTDSDFIEFLFGPKPGVPGFEKSLPYPMWIWGWDSI